MPANTIEINWGTRWVVVDSKMDELLKWLDENAAEKPSTKELKDKGFPVNDGGILTVHKAQPFICPTSSLQVGGEALYSIIFT